MVPSTHIFLPFYIGSIVLLQARAFAPPPSCRKTSLRNNNCDAKYQRNNNGCTTASSSSVVVVFSSPVPTGDRPPPRRTLKKRKNKRRQRREQGSKQNNDGMHKNRQLVLSKSNELEDDIDIEIRPIRRRDAVEAGLDYWMDETDLVKERQQRKAVKNRKSMEGSISKDKLRNEVVAPYKQNWIGIFSMFIVILSVIGSKFPELLQVPVIPIPDL